MHRCQKVEKCFLKIFLKSLLLATNVKKCFKTKTYFLSLKLGHRLETPGFSWYFPSSPQNVHKVIHRFGG